MINLRNTENQDLLIAQQEWDEANKLIDKSAELSPTIKHAIFDLQCYIPVLAAYQAENNCCQSLESECQFNILRLQKEFKETQEQLDTYCVNHPEFDVDQIDWHGSMGVDREIYNIHKAISTKESELYSETRRFALYAGSYVQSKINRDHFQKIVNKNQETLVTECNHQPSEIKTALKNYASILQNLLQLRTEELTRQIIHVNQENSLFKYLSSSSRTKEILDDFKKSKSDFLLLECKNWTGYFGKRDQFAFVVTRGYDDINTMPMKLTISELKKNDGEHIADLRACVCNSEAVYKAEKRSLIPFVVPCSLCGQAFDYSYDPPEWRNSEVIINSVRGEGMNGFLVIGVIIYSGFGEGPFDTRNFWGTREKMPTIL